ncbi:MAG: MBL fold metallo-hydrolase [Chloroflexota bacterium]|nr:MBL fold metallo-hydrolase [Chloroflexota bacterium]
MEISWLGNWAVRVQSGQTAVVSDPYYAEDGARMPETSADIVTVSIDAPRHSNAGAVGGSPRVLRGPGEYEIANFYISGMGTPYGDAEDADGRQVSTVYAMRAEGVRVCHAGGSVPSLSSRQLDELNNVEVLVVDASGGESAAKRVARLVQQVGPRIVVPVGWQAGADGAGDDDAGALGALLGELGASDVSPRATLRVTATSLPREMSVVVLSAQAG